MKVIDDLNCPYSPLIPLCDDTTVEQCSDCIISESEDNNTDDSEESK